jgi:hypothetical protein
VIHVQDLLEALFELPMAAQLLGMIDDPYRSLDSLDPSSRVKFD